MFWHNFKYSLKTLFRNKSLIFWTFIFPIIMATLFNMAFSNIENSEKMNIIDIAIIDNNEWNNNQIYKTSFENLSSESNEEKIFNIHYLTNKEADQLLNSGEIIGILELVDDKPILKFNTNGVDQTVLKFVTEEIEQTESLIKNLSKVEIQKQIESGNYIDYEGIYSKVLELATEENVKLRDDSKSNLSYTMIEFYTLIAMTCLYGGILSMTSINESMPNMSNKGKRISISPSKKRTVILSSLLASFIVQLVGLSLLFIYTIFALKINYGNNILLIILLSVIGSLAGVSFGTFAGCMFKANENAKTGILIAVTMFGCFLSGMMGVTMKYVVDTNIPIINKLNPANMITDGFYSLYYYADNLDRYWFNIISLLIFSVVLIVISSISLRRQKYDSI